MQDRVVDQPVPQRAGDVFQGGAYDWRALGEAELTVRLALASAEGVGLSTPDEAGVPVPGRPKVVMLHGLVIDNLSSWYYTLAHPLALVADVPEGAAFVPATSPEVAAYAESLRRLFVGR